jgi:hypothetical protein
MGFINMTEDGEHDDEPLGVYKMFGNYWVGVLLVTSQEGFSYMSIIS